jgi:predicted DNA-binding transcriptional regulator YafY
VTDRAKTINEAIYYNVDAIHRAMNENVQISFQYSEWGTDKKLHLKKDGMRYQVSPYQLIWNDANYYLVAYDEEESILKHYRVDKMSGVWQEKKRRNGSERFKNFNPAIYSNRTFGMYGGSEELVQICFDNSMIGVVMDRFGSDIDIRVLDQDTFSIRVYVMVSPQFFGWLAGLGKNAQISGPAQVADEYHNYLQQIINAYKE